MPAVPCARCCSHGAAGHGTSVARSERSVVAARPACLLVAPLHRAVTLEKVHGIAMRVGKHLNLRGKAWQSALTGWLAGRGNAQNRRSGALTKPKCQPVNAACLRTTCPPASPWPAIDCPPPHLYVSGPRDEALQQHALVAKGGRRLAPRRVQRILQAGEAPHGGMGCGSRAGRVPRASRRRWAEGQADVRKAKGINPAPAPAAWHPAAAHQEVGGLPCQLHALAAAPHHCLDKQRVPHPPRLLLRAAAL